MLGRFAAGSMAGLMTALGALFLVSTLGLPLQQTGSSPGKMVFLCVWPLCVVVALGLRDTGRVVGCLLLAAGVLFAASAAVPLMQVHSFGQLHASVLEVTAALTFSAATLAAIGARLLRGRAGTAGPTLESRQ